MTVSPAVTDQSSTIRAVPKPTPATRPRRAVEPLRGTQARLTVEIQGRVWTAKGAVGTIAHHVETGDAIDQRGDALFMEHRRQLRRALRLARTERASQTAALLVELIASADIVAELDESEDWHRRQTGLRASDADPALMAANAVCSLLLGHAEAELPDGMLVELPYPLDGVLAPGICGAERAPMGAIGFERCRQPAGHERDDGVHVFLAQRPESETGNG